MVEAWKPIAGYEGLYEVSDQGRVRSCDRFVLVRRKHKIHQKPLQGRFLRQTKNNHGYFTVALSRNCQPKTYSVHGLVLTAFVGPKPEGFECCHWNGDPTDNRLENLRWDTPKANGEDRARLGRYRGEKRVNSRLTEETVIAVRIDLAAGKSQRQIARAFEVSKSCIQAIADGRSWTWMP
jgi:hypothetical protein